MKVLLIGGSRFTGPAIVAELLKKNYEVTVFNRGNITERHDPKVRFIKGDRNSGFNLRDHFDAVIDTCAYTKEQIKRSLGELQFDYYLFVSTAAVYRKTHVFPLTEVNSPRGPWPVWGEYSARKIECEEALEHSGAAHAIVRPVYILGPHNPVDRENFIYSRLRNNTPLTLPGNGSAIIQFIFVQDIARIYARLVEQKITGIFNCAGSEGITLIGLVEEMARIVGVPPQIEFNPAADGDKFDERQFPFANENFFCDNIKLKQLGFTPSSLITGLRQDYVGYYRDFR
ncbi:MAG: NAD-dependent epimerase/dehydratase family protein [Candidatus Magasanikbacteria bacterium]|nr:NAD-dependent epimerase/dehydratase family protein [Candidatus Magasanikbacteria bacterium]